MRLNEIHIGKSVYFIVCCMIHQNLATGWKDTAIILYMPIGKMAL